MEDKGKTVDDVYFDHLQRGGLSVPTEEVIAPFIHMYAIMEAIIYDGILESRFLQSENHKHILCKLTYISIQSDIHYLAFSDTCVCGRAYHSILFKLL